MIAAAAVLTTLMALPLAASAADRAYWTNFEVDAISFANLDGSGGGDLALPGASPGKREGIALDPAGGRIYWANVTANRISYANLDGSGGGDLNTSGATVKQPNGIAIDSAARKIYWGNFELPGSTISYANLDGSGGGGDLNTAGATISNPTGVAIDPATRRIYWASLLGEISYAALDGSGGNNLNTAGAMFNSPRGVAIDAPSGRILWVNEQPPANISFARLDSTGGGQLATAGATLDFPTYLALLRGPGAAGAPAIGGRALVGSRLTCPQGAWEPDVPDSHLYRAPSSFAYQWLKSGSDVGGATRETFKPRSPGSYSCRVTATNQAGSTAQTSAALRVKAAHGTAFAAAVALVKRGRALLRMRCRGTTRCSGTVVLRARGEPPRHSKVAARWYGSADLSIAPGKRRVVPVKLHPRSLLRDAPRHRLKVRLTGIAVKSRIVLLKAVKRRRR